MVLIINYALNNGLKDYNPLFNAIKGCGEWWHFMESTWIVNTVYSADVVGKHLQKYIDTNTDHLLVMRLQRESQGWLPNEAWNWINSKQY